MQILQNYVGEFQESIRKPRADLWVFPPLFFFVFRAKMLVASFLLLASSSSLFTFGLETAASREPQPTLSISSAASTVSSSQPLEARFPYEAPMSLQSNLNGPASQRLRRLRRRLRRRGRRRRSRGRRNIAIVSRPWRTTATTSSPLALYESFGGDTQTHVSTSLR